MHKRVAPSKIAGLLLAMAFAGTVQADTAASSDPGTFVSMINLIATPEKFHGKLIYVRGYFHAEFENMSLCLQTRALSPKDCVWVETYDDNEGRPLLDPKSARKLAACNHKVVAIRGIFNQQNTGHMGLYAGAIDPIREIQSPGCNLEVPTKPRSAQPESSATRH